MCWHSHTATSTVAADRVAGVLSHALVKANLLGGPWTSNKIVHVFTFLATPAALAGVSRVQAMFLRSGHSHEDVDQQHGQMSAFTRNKLDRAETLDDFQVALTQYG